MLHPGIKVYIAEAINLGKFSKEKRGEKGEKTFEISV